MEQNTKQFDLDLTANSNSNSNSFSDSDNSDIVEIEEEEDSSDSYASNTNTVNGLYCGVLRRKLTKIQDQVCPLKPPHRCMWKNVKNGKCAYTNKQDLTKEEFCERVSLKAIPDDKELKDRQLNLQTLLKPLVDQL